MKFDQLKKKKKKRLPTRAHYLEFSIQIDIKDFGTIIFIFCTTLYLRFLIFANYSIYVPYVFFMSFLAPV